MTATPEPSAEHIDAVARQVAAHIGRDVPTDPHSWRCYDKERYPGPCECDEDLAEDILTSADPAVHAAMIDALTRHGALTEERSDDPVWGERRLVTPWEVAP